MVCTNLQGYHTYWNQVFEDDYGWLYEKTGLAGAYSLNSICEYHHKKTLETVEKCMANPGVVAKVELDKPAKNNKIRTTLWEFMCITDEENIPKEIQCIGTEITQLKQLRESEERFKKIIDYSSDIIIMLDKDGRQTMISPISEKITGFKPKELIGKSIRDIIHPDDLPDFIKTYGKILENPNQWFKAQYRHIHKTKGWIWMEGNAQNFLNYSEFNSVLLTVRDISDNKEKELEMKKLTIAIEQSPTTVVITDIEGIIEYVNPKFEEITGYTREEVIGKNPKILKSGLQSKAFYNEMWNALTNGKTWRGEICNKKKEWTIVLGISLHHSCF